MEICRFARHEVQDNPRLSVILEDGIHDGTEIAQAMPALCWLLIPGDQLIANLSALRSGMEEKAVSMPAMARERIKLLSPVANPNKFVCGAENWRYHGAPSGMRGFMGKAASAIAGPDGNVLLSWPRRAALHEPELAIIIGRTCRNVSVVAALGSAILARETTNMA